MAFMPSAKASRPRDEANRAEIPSLLELLDVSASHVAVINVTTNRAQRKGLPGLD